MDIPETVKFEDVIEILKDKLSSKLKILNLKEEIILLEGFMHHPYTTELPNALFITKATDNIFFMNGPTIPLIACIGEQTGMLYFFSYRQLMEE